ncbi:hypothetical protein LXL04_005285 [Taraxacum kok-saghyz]
MEICGVDEQENHKSTGFDAPGTTVMTSTDDQRGIWEIDVRAQQQNLLHEMNDPSMFYNDQFPQIPDFPCMSSSSSSSSNPAPAKPISSATTTSSASSGSSSTSSAASWAVLKSEYVTEEEAEGDEELRINRRKRSHREEPVPVMTTAPAVEAVPPLDKADGSGTIDCMDVMEDFGYMDLIDGNEIWDPSSIFEQNPPDLQQECVTATRGYSNGSEEGNKKQKTGCHCLMSHCMHKLCSCLKAGVACSNLCQCDGCRNVNGKKGDNSEVKSDASLDLKL